MEINMAGTTGSVLVTWRCKHQPRDTERICPDEMCRGSWYARVKFPGHKPLERGGFTEEGDAQDWGNQEQAKLILGISDKSAESEKPVVTVNTLMDAYEEYLSDRVLSKTMAPSTRDGYLINIKLYIRPILGEESLDNLNYKRVRKFHVQCREINPNLSGTAQKNINATLSASISYCQREEEEKEWFTRNNPCKGQRFEPSRHKARVWEFEHVRHFWQVAREDEYFPVYALCTFEGVRRGESIGLYEEAIDWKNDLWICDRQVTKDLWPLTGPLKTDAKGVSVKYLALSAQAKEIIEFLIERRRELKAAAFREGRPFYADPEGRSLLCIDENGKPLDPTKVTKHFASVCRFAGLPKIRVQDLRATHANLAQAVGASPRLIQDMLGHREGTAVTNRHYLQSNIADQRRIHQALSERLALPSDEDGDDPGNNVVALRSDTPT